MFYDVLSYRQLFQHLIIPGYVDAGGSGFQLISRIPTCIIVYLPLEEIIPGKLFPKKYCITGIT